MLRYRNLFRRQFKRQLSSMAISKIEIIVSPFHCGAEDVSVAKGPDYILQRGLVGALEAAGKAVHVTRMGSVQDSDTTGDVGFSFEVMRRLSPAVKQAVSSGAFPVILAGNCNTSVGVAAGLNFGPDGDANDGDIVWFDAHPDFDTPDEQAGGYFDQNGVSLLGGQCWARQRASIPGHRPLDLRTCFTYVGLRDMDRATYPAKIENAGIRTVWGRDRKPANGYAAGLADLLERADEVAVARKGRDCLVHFDVDSLDIEVGVANFAASAGGLSKDDAVKCIAEVKRLRNPVAITVASFDPSGERTEGIADATIAAVVELVS